MKPTFFVATDKNEVATAKVLNEMYNMIIDQAFKSTFNIMYEFKRDEYQKIGKLEEYDALKRLKS